MNKTIDSILKDLEFSDREKEIFKKSVTLTKLTQSEDDIDVKKILFEDIEEEFK